MSVQKQDMKQNLPQQSAKWGKNRKRIRINVGIEHTAEGRRVMRFSGQPGWQNDDKVPGSGLF